MANQKVRVGLIGLGSISYAHEAGYSEMEETCEIVALCDINDEEVNNRIEMHPGAKGYTRYQDLLADPQVDMVDIIVPHVLHYEIAKSALENGKHVLVEKPITVMSDPRGRTDCTGKAEGTQIQRCRKYSLRYRLSESGGNPLRKDYSVIFGRVRTLIAGSEVYRIKDPNLWHGKAPYGGVILDSSVHNFYLFKWLFGGVRDVMGFASKAHSRGRDGRQRSHPWTPGKRC